MLVINPRLWLPIIILGCIFGFAGYLTDQNWPGTLDPNGILVGAIFGALLGFTLALFLQQQRKRWIVGALLVILITAAYGVGGYIDALLAAAGIAITFFVSAVILKDLYGGDEIEAFRHHLRILFAERGDLTIVEGGKIAVPREKGLLLGPRQVIVKPGNAVIMESGSKITRVCGPSIFQTNNFEYIKTIIDISRDRKSLTLPHILTRDSVPIVIEMTYVFGAAVSSQTIRGENSSLIQRDKSQGVTESESESLRNLATIVPQWQSHVHEVVRAAAREIVAAENYSNVTTLSDYGDLANRIQDRARRRLILIGIRIDSMRVVQLSPAPQIVDALAEAERIKTHELAAGEAWRLAMTAIAQGYRAATGTFMSAEDVHRETQRFMMEHISHDQATKIVMASEPNGALREVQTARSILDGVIEEPITV